MDVSDVEAMFGLRASEAAVVKVGSGGTRSLWDDNARDQLVKG